MNETLVLVVDKDESVRLETADLVREGVDDASVLTASSTATARDALENQSVDVVVTGYNLPDGNGLELADWIRDEHPGTGCILYTADATIDTDTFEDVIVEYVTKGTPTATETLHSLIEEAGPELTQSAHPVPERETIRLAAAEGLHERENRLEIPLRRIAELAVDHFDVEGGAISLILRERQEPLAQEGAVDLPVFREDSLATHTLVADLGSMAVEDTRTDPRFAETTAIQDADLVSYLGAPVTNADGEPVAVLSIYDNRPRRYEASDRAYIELLAALAGDVVALGSEGENHD